VNNFFLKTLNRDGSLLLKRMIVMVIVSDIVVPAFQMGGSCFGGGMAIRSAEWAVSSHADQ
jgi:hypothetical protein